MPEFGQNARISGLLRTLEWMTHFTDGEENGNMIIQSRQQHILACRNSQRLLYIPIESFVYSQIELIPDLFQLSNRPNKQYLTKLSCGWRVLQCRGGGGGRRRKKPHLRFRLGKINALAWLSHWKYSGARRLGCGIVTVTQVKMGALCPVSPMVVL